MKFMSCVKFAHLYDFIIESMYVKRKAYATMGNQDEQPEPEKVLEDRYELQSIIGSGGMASI